MIQLRKMLIGAMVALMATTKTFAQVVGFGSGTLLPPTVVNGLMYTDNIRAKVFMVTYLNYNQSAELLLDANNTHGSFAVGDVCLLIQMKGDHNSIGTHQNVTITGLSPLTVQPVSGGYMHTYDFLSTSVPENRSNCIQLIKIPQYQSLTVNQAGVVTCHDWDGATGGVVCLIVNGNLQINGGTFNVSKKGFRPEDAGAIFPDGAAGSPGMKTNDLLAKRGPTSAARYLHPTHGCLDTLVNKGGKGGSANNTTVSGSGIQWRWGNASGPISYGGSYKHSRLVMGDPGFARLGATSGAGGGGGGHGGNGAFSNNLILPGGGATLPGQPGLPGGKGGRMGRGGNGGGAMIIKVGGSVYTSGTKPVFIADGGDGEPGGQGGNGGEGGQGGKGWIGNCDYGAFVPQGGNGGYGDNGIGAEGGAGGSGGKAGFIWVAISGSFNAPMSRTNYLSVKGGRGGAEGIGGLGGENNTALVIDIPNECFSGRFCPPPTPCERICDADRAMCILSTARIGFTLGDTIYYYIGRTCVAVYYKSINMLESYSINQNCTTTYIANWRKTTSASADPDLFFQHLAGGAGALPNLPVISPLNWSTSGCGNPISYPLNINLGVSGTGTILRYKTNSPNDPKVFEDVSGYNGSITPDFCHPNMNKSTKDSSWMPYNGGPGENMGFATSWRVPGPGNLPGEDAEDGSNDTGNPDDNGSIDEGWYWIWQPTGLQDVAKEISLFVFPNPATEQIQVKWQGWANGMLNINVRDISGKLCMSQAASQVSGNNLLDLNISNLKSGLYLLELTDGERKYVQKIIVE